MALFDFLKGLTASERRELDETKQRVSDLKKEIELLREESAVNILKSVNLFIDTKAPNKAPDNQITVVI